MLERLLEAARWAPSGYNLQPTHFVIALESDTKRRLHQACMQQRQVVEAPAVVVFTGDTAAARNNLDAFLKSDLDAGAITPDYAQFIRRMVRLAFHTGPFGLGWLAKASLVPMLGLLRPIPSIPAVHRRYWLAKQVALAAMNFMLAAQSAGLATCPMEGFDSRRVRRALGIPRRHLPMIVIPVGYAARRDATKTRLPLGRMVHYDKW